MPGGLDRSEPSGSWLELSELLGGAGRERLTAPSLNSWDLDAGLLTLSRTRWTTVAGSGAGRPPLVSGALAGGARAVIASGWTATDPVADGVLASTYDGIAAGRAVDEALALAQRAAREAGTDAREWARLQLWVD
jgi:hypothetical protein